jgi:hypothetical protein
MKRGYMHSIRLLVALAGLLFSAVVPAKADDIGIVGTKLVLLANPNSAKFKVVYKSKLDPGIHKGAGGDPTLLDGTFDWFYTDQPMSVFGSFVLAPVGWITNSDSVAKWVNSNPAPTGKVAIIKPGLLAKFVGLLLGDTGGGIFATEDAPSDSGGVTTVLEITNGNDSSTHRMCTQFAVDLGSIVIFKEIAGGTGRKLVAKNGVPAACP